MTHLNPMPPISNVPKIIKFLTEEFGIKTGKVKIIKGEKEKIKIIRIN